MGKNFTILLWTRDGNTSVYASEYSEYRNMVIVPGGKLVHLYIFV